MDHYHNWVEQVGGWVCSLCGTHPWSIYDTGLSSKEVTDKPATLDEEKP